MAKLATEQIFDGSIDVVPYGQPYDPSKINVGPHVGQYKIGPNDVDKFIGPAPVLAVHLGMIDQNDGSTTSVNVHSIYKFSPTLYYIFSFDTALTPVKVRLIEFNTQTMQLKYCGIISITMVGTGQVVNSCEVLVNDYTTGTVGVSGTSVTGSGTTWATGLSAGSRIGFGSTDPTQITTWYHISAIGSDTSITLTTNAGNIASGTPYVIQDMMFLMVGSSGLYVTKGLSLLDFTFPAKAIPLLPTGQDKIKGNVWLKDSPFTNTNAVGLFPDEFESWTRQNVYVGNGSINVNFYRYNVRAPLTVTSGEAILTGDNMVVSTTQILGGGSGIRSTGGMFKIKHGQVANTNNIYVASSSTSVPNIYRINQKNITANSSPFAQDEICFRNILVGGSTTAAIPLSSGFIFTYCDLIDRLIIQNTQSTQFYIMKYTTTETPEKMAGVYLTQKMSPYRNNNVPLRLASKSTIKQYFKCKDGWLITVSDVQVAGRFDENTIMVYPLGADNDYVSITGNRIICPKIELPSNVKSLSRLMINNVKLLGDNVHGETPEATFAFFRTSGIDDNSGDWIPIPQNGDLSGVYAKQIQFSFTFRTLGMVMIPARIMSISLLYETYDELPEQYRWNFMDFDLSNGTVAWYQKSLFSELKEHEINIYRADSGALVLTQKSGSSIAGNFQYWNGSTWVNGLGSNVIGTRRRFVPNDQLPSTNKLRIRITA